VILYYHFHFIKVRQKKLAELGVRLFKAISFSSTHVVDHPVSIQETLASEGMVAV